MIKISDFIPESNEKRYSFVDKIINIKSGTDLSEGKGVPVLMELSLREKKFIGEITIIDGESKSDNINIDFIIDAMNYHYGESSYKFESSTFPNVFNNEIRKMFETVKNETKINNNKAFLMKIGSHSGAFEVTMEGYRKIKIKTKYGDKESDKQTTIWTHDLNELKKLPLGWVKCVIIKS